MISLNIVGFTKIITDLLQSSDAPTHWTKHTDLDNRQDIVIILTHFLKEKVSMRIKNSCVGTADALVSVCPTHKVLGRVLRALWSCDMGSSYVRLKMVEKGLQHHRLRRRWME